MKIKHTLKNETMKLSHFNENHVQAPSPPPKETPRKEKPLKEVKTPLPQWPVKELVAGLAKIEIPPGTIPTTIPTTVRTKKIGKDLETPKTRNSKPSSQKKSVKKKKEPFLESEEEEESTEGTRSSGGGAESEEEPEPATPLPEKRKRMDMRASDKKKSTSTFKTPVTPKQLVKTLGKVRKLPKKAKGQVDRN